MMKKVVLACLLCALFPLLSSCDLNDDGPNFHFTTLSVVEASLPESFQLNQTYTVEVTYLRPDSCTFFEGFDVATVAETQRNVTVIGSVITDDETCTQLAEEVTASFEFNVIFTGTYTFRFYTGDDESGDATFIEYTVPVVEDTN
ncbi:hypothetical protein ACOKFD_12835 [Flagellimonas sp. S174]|uniref:hypothetical protein n=1 Tax=Flagellimonas sp. S174 TaxID=3410790 RepID=UPI003BF61300